MPKIIIIKLLQPLKQNQELRLKMKYFDTVIHWLREGFSGIISKILFIYIKFILLVLYIYNV